RDHRLDLVAAEHLVDARLLDVQDLAFERQNRLEPAVAPLLGRAAGRFALDDVEFALRRIALLAVGELPGQRAAVEGALAAHQVARFPRGFPRARRVDYLGETSTRARPVLFAARAKPVADHRLDPPFASRVPQPSL